MYLTTDADQIDKVVLQLINTKPELVMLKQARIMSIFNDKPSVKEDNVNISAVAKIKALGEVDKIISEYKYDFVLEIAKDAWDVSDPILREAMIYHALLHPRYDSEKQKWSLAPHEFEGFHLEEQAQYSTWQVMLSDLLIRSLNKPKIKNEATHGL